MWSASRNAAYGGETKWEPSRVSVRTRRRTDSALGRMVLEVPACTTRIVRLLPRLRHLTGDFLFANAHGIQAATDAESMREGLFIQQAIKAVPFLQFQIVLGSQKAQYGIDGEGRIAPHDKLGAIASGEHDHFLDALALGEHRQHFCLAATAHPEALTDFDSRRPVIEPDHYQCRFHRHAP